MKEVDRLLEEAHRIAMEIDVKTSPSERRRIEARERKVLGQIKAINPTIHQRVMA